MFDVITYGKQTSEKRLMIDILSFCQSHKCLEIDRVALIHGGETPTDGLSKVMSENKLKKFRMWFRQYTGRTMGDSL